MMCKYSYFFIASVYLLILTYFLLFLFIEFYLCICIQTSFLGSIYFLWRWVLRSFLNLEVGVVHSKMSGREINADVLCREWP